LQHRRSVSLRPEAVFPAVRCDLQLFAPVNDDEALRGAALVPREGVLEIQVVNERELIALQTRGIAELKVRERKTAERRENERLQAEAKEVERVDIEADQEAVNPY